MGKKYQKKYLKPDWMKTEGHWLVGTVWPVTGSTGNQYGVELTDKGFECNCPAYVKCKHIKAIEEKIVNES